MTHKDIATKIISEFLMALMAGDDANRRMFKIHVYDSLDWYEFAESDQDRIYNEIVRLVGDFDQPFE